MLRFEIKKIFSRTRNRVAVAFLLVVLVVVSMLTVNMVEYTDENGESSTGIAAARELRAEKNAHAGYITGDVLAEAVRENDAINSSPEALSDDIRQQNIAYGEKQGIEDILSLINQAFSPWREYNYYAADSVTEEEARTVYDRRISNLEDVLDSGQETVNADEREYLTDKYRELETPFYYEYFDGWSALLMYGNTYILILALVTGCLTAGIFSDEFRLKTDSVFFSTRLGRSGGTRAKLAAGVIIATGVYVTFSILYTFIVLAVLGADGAGCPIQLDLWRSSYNITFLQAYLLMVLGGYIGTLLTALLGMLVSAVTRMTTAAIIVPFIVLCAVPFLSRIVTLSKLFALFPDKLMQVYTNLSDFDFVKVFGHVFETATVIIPLYGMICLLLLPLIYFIYRKAELR